MISGAIKIPVRYLAWHYGRAIGESLHLWATGFRFVTRLFAVPLHLRTFFSPFERLGESAVGGSMGDRLEAAVVSLVMRLVGVAMRLGVILAALAAYTATFALGLAGLLAWLVLPLALALSLWLGLRGLLAGTFR